MPVVRPSRVACSASRQTVSEPACDSAECFQQRIFPISSAVGCGINSAVALVEGTIAAAALFFIPVPFYIMDSRFKTLTNTPQKLPLFPLQEIGFDQARGYC